MDINNLQQIWSDYDEQLSKKTHLNKEVLKQKLMTKPQKKLNELTERAGIEIVGYALLVVLFFVKFVDFRGTLFFVLCLVVFLAILVYSFTERILYFQKMYRMNLSDSMLTMKKKINEAHVFKKKITIRAYILLPVELCAAWFMLSPKMMQFLGNFPQRPIEYFNIILGIVLIISFRLLDKRTMSDSFKNLKKELDEIEELERD